VTAISRGFPGCLSLCGNNTAQTVAKRVEIEHDACALSAGFFAKAMDGRIDDPKAGWKGKGVWTTWATRTPFHGETGTGTTAKAVHFQIRPDPLAN
jgi:hypothetical protein